MPSSSIQPKTDWRGIKKLLDYTYVYKTSMLENSKEYRLALFENEFLTHHGLKIPGKWGLHVPHYTYNRHAGRIKDFHQTIESICSF